MSRKSSLRDGSARQLHQQLAASHRVAIVVGIVACQWVCSAYLWLLAAVYVYVDLPEMTYYGNLLALPSTRRLSFWGYAHLAVAVLHAADILVLVLFVLAQL
ncbi:hypothetical protein PINS_up012513 [Pythium insidiosum]|nr:hypothetical protein PINS_up012513 [Pythium insidiosum]